MELYYAIKSVIDLQGRDSLKNVNVINILGDFKAYEEFPASRNLIKNMVNEGLMEKMLIEFSGSSNIRQFLTTYKSALSDTLGFNTSLADYVINCLAYALGWINEVPSFNKGCINNDNNIYHNNNYDEFVNDGQHILFKQIPITGDVNSFVDRLSSKGYTLIEPYNYVYNVASLSGTFAGNHDCSIAVVATPKSHITCGVMIFLQEHRIWHSLKDEYIKIKNQLSKKYGTPQSYEYFSEPYYEGDNSELTALWCDHCTYLSLFEVPNGRISLSMTKEAKVMICYHDKINNDIKEMEESSLADDDF